MSTLIDISTLTLFSDMTNPSNVRDGSTSTWAYTSTPTGYAGVGINKGYSIDSAQADPGAYGFDGYNNTKNIVISLYGKVSGTPSNSTDGTLLGSISFAGGNGLTRTINSNDNTTLFDSVWIRVSSDGGGVAVLSEIRFYGVSAPTTNIKKLSGITHASIKKICGFSIASIKKISGVQ